MCADSLPSAPGVLASCFFLAGVSATSSAFFLAAMIKLPGLAVLDTPNFLNRSAMGLFLNRRLYVGRAVELLLVGFLCVASFAGAFLRLGVGDSFDSAHMV